jgi:alpha-galactosidase/6-phospho-beta-glucosidase family protein
MAKITVIGGGSSTFTPQLIRLFLKSNVLGGSTITLMDIDPHRLEIMTALSKSLVDKEKADLKIECTTDQKESLVDADFVITAISVGGFDAWEKDIEIPAKHGVYMPIADSIGPGGMMRAFRHIPVLANTMAMNRQSNIRTVGLCTCSSIPRNGEYLGDLIGAKSQDLLLPAPAGGLNHCAAILDLRFRDGKDAFPLLKERVRNPVQRWGLGSYEVLPYCWSHWIEFFPSLCQLDEEYRGRLQGLKMKYGIRVHDMEREKARAKKWETLVEDMSRGSGRGISLKALPEAEAVEVIQIMEGILENRNEIHVSMSRTSAQ